MKTIDLRVSYRVLLSATNSNPQAGIKPLLRKFLSGLERELNRVPVKLQSTYILLQCLSMYHYSHSP